MKARFSLESDTEIDEKVPNGLEANAINFAMGSSFYDLVEMLMIVMAEQDGVYELLSTAVEAHNKLHEQNKKLSDVGVFGIRKEDLSTKKGS